MKIWILTSEVNAYDQYGEYFVTAFKEKPTVGKLIALGLPKDYAESCVEMGGRRVHPTTGMDTWWYLKEHNI